MNYKMMPVINASELVEAVNLQYNIKIDNIATLFWDGDYMNDCCKYLCFDDDMIEEAEEDENNEQLCVLTYLKDTFKDCGYDTVLIDVSW